MPEEAKKHNPVFLNLGCGFLKWHGMVNVDKYPSCEPEVVWDLDVFPWPWEDESVDGIFASHVFEHLSDWWRALCECARIMKPMGMLDIRVPDESSGNAATYRDHKTVFSIVSLHGICGYGFGRSAWANELDHMVPLRLRNYWRVPFEQYKWMPKWLLAFCGNHLRNFIWEQRFQLVKIPLPEWENMLKEFRKDPVGFAVKPTPERLRTVIPFSK